MKRHFFTLVGRGNLSVSVADPSATFIENLLITKKSEKLENIWSRKMTKFNHIGNCKEQIDQSNQFSSDKHIYQKPHYEMSHVNVSGLSQNGYSDSLTNMLESKMSGLMSHQIELNDDSSSISSTASTEEHHILAPRCMAGKNRPCLTWACKACKKKNVTIDRRKAATLRERRRLRKVKRPRLPTAKINADLHQY